MLCAGAIHTAVGAPIFSVSASSSDSAPPCFFAGATCSRSEHCSRARTSRKARARVVRSRANFRPRSVSKHFRREGQGDAPMRKRIRRRHDAHVRAYSVCTEHSALFDATAGGQKTRAALGAHVADVDRLLALQERSIEDRRAATEQCRLLRQTLRNAASAVVKVGKLVHLDDTVMATMQFPGSPSDDELLAYSRGLLDRVSAHAEAFVADGLPPDLLKHLADAIQAFAAARDAQAASRQRFTAAAESIRETLDKASKTVGV